MDEKKPKTVRMTDHQWHKVKILAAIRNMNIGKLIYKLVLKEFKEDELQE